MQLGVARTQETPRGVGARTNMLDAMSQHHLVENLSSLLAHERVVHLRRGPRGAQFWLLVAVESGTRDGPLILDGGGGALGALCRFLYDGFRGSGVARSAVGRDSGSRGRGREGARGSGIEALEGAARRTCLEHCEWRWGPEGWGESARSERTGEDNHVA